MNFKRFKMFAMAGVLAASMVPAGSAFAAAGTYEGTGTGKGGEIKASVTLDDDGKITDIQVEAAGETQGLGDIAIDQLVSEILDKQSIAVDGVSGATLSSNGLLEAVTAALTAAGVNLDDYKNEVAEEKAEDTNIDTEIVVIGAGGAGMAAAAAASDAGAKVVVLEKMSAIGGNTRVGEGTYNVADEALLEKTGTKTTPDMEKEVEDAIAVETDDEKYKSLLEDTAADFEAWKESGTDTLFDSANWHALQTYLGGGEIGDLDLIRTFADGAVGTYEWLTDDIGVQFKDDYIFMPIGGKWTRGHQIDMTAATGAEGDNGGNVYITKLKERTDKNGVEILTDAKVTEITKNDDGRVTGAIAERSDGSKITVNASKAVILTTGGFAANPDMVLKYSNGTITTKLTSCAVSSTGDGIPLAEAVGASMTDLDQIQVHPLGDPKDGCVAEFVGNWLGAQYYMFVNKEGQRFVKEDGTRYEMSQAELKQTDSEMWLIVDSSQIAGDDSRTDQINSLLADGHTVKGDTIEELAEKIGVDPATLQATVDKYNEGMQNGEDEFGKATDPNATISVAPFYASLRTPTVHHTMGGVTINTDAQVLDTDGNVIPGFYAAGEVTGGIHGNNRLGGNAFADIMTYGRIAGTNAAAE